MPSHQARSRVETRRQNKGRGPSPSMLQLSPHGPCKATLAHNRSVERSFAGRQRLVGPGRNTARTKRTLATDRAGRRARAHPRLLALYIPTFLARGWRRNRWLVDEKANLHERRRLRAANATRRCSKRQPPRAVPRRRPYAPALCSRADRPASTRRGGSCRRAEAARAARRCRCRSRGARLFLRQGARCASFCAEPYGGKESVLGEITMDDVKVTALLPEQRLHDRLGRRPCDVRAGQSVLRAFPRRPHRA